jgi:N6-adenosine-specific RNA methylase IME4
MAGALAKRQARFDLTDFKPEESRKRLTVADAGMRFATGVKDLALFEQAARAKVAEVRELVLWWDANVRDPGGTEAQAIIRKSEQLTVNQAVEACGFTAPRISEWRTRLERDGYAGEDWFKAIIARFRIKIGLDHVPVHREAIIIPPGKYGCIVIDPPWPMQKIEREVRPNQYGFDYPTMTEDELLDYAEVDAKAADDCHLFCWTTQKFLPLALRLVSIWGFDYVCAFVWHKPGGFQPVGLPQFNCEFALYGRRGTPRFADTADFSTCFAARRRQHSRKPDAFYDMIRRVTNGPRIDMFSREAHEGFAQHGNEIEKFPSIA